MLKGKTINSTETEQYGIRQTISSAHVSPASLKPKLISNECSGVEPIYNTINTMKPKIIKHVISDDSVEYIMKQIAEPSIKTLYYSKTINPNTNTDKSTEIIQRTQNIRYALEELKSRFPGYSTLYYSEIFELLQTTDYNLTELNLNSNLQKFINLGNNIQSQISRLHQNLNLLSKNSFKNIKSTAKDTIGFFAMEESVNSAFIDFNNDAYEYSLIIYKELQDLKSIDFSKYFLVNLYLDVFLFIWDELKKKFPDSDLDSIQSRAVSLNNSKIVLKQFMNLVQIEIQGKEIEYNNVKNYLDALLPGLSILKKQNFKEFKEQFRNLIKD